MKVFLILVIVNMAIITQSLPIEEDFNINPDSYVSFNVTVEEGINYWIEINSSDSYQLFYLNQSNFELFQDSEDFYDISGNKIQFISESPLYFNFGSGLSLQWKTNYTGEVIIVLYNNHEEVITGNILFEKRFNKSTDLNFLSILFLFPSVVVLRKFLHKG